ncbi:arylsulfatase [Tropicimonas sp. IMCC34043]|uniref:arylsulfatase n=1 Tax=Tropicimonas sp. IMCC34043 TaxID=2248760 RepID=UPI001E2F6844|nr:sulfatase-like hydrolase/transferase [Tropicimonas sp. IMCC34043]
MTSRLLFRLAIGLGLTALGTMPGFAQDNPAGVAIDSHVTTGMNNHRDAAPAPGSPDATAVIDGNYIPNVPPSFAGTIELNAHDSTPYWPPRIVPPQDAPNVLVILTDDTGFGAGSTFGGVIPMPALDQLAADGLRYTNFNSTALCSPSRAALLTGRNHHNAGFGVIAEQSTGYPGYDSVIGRDEVAVATILSANGYNTSWYGKNHNTPPYTESQVGPFDQWPTGEVFGFDHFYGFMGGDANQWQPNLFNDTTQIYPFRDNPGWNLITAEADDAIRQLETLNSIDPDKKFFVYLAPGATHAPHHPTKEWVDKIEAMHLFDDGWNKLRDTIFAKQKELGVIPQTAELTPWPDDLKQWDDLSDDEKKLFLRQVNVYAAYLAYADHENGRVIDTIRRMGKLDNTLIIYIVGDNGSSAEGSPIGTPNEVAQFNGVTPPVDVQLKDFYDLWGTDQTYNHMAVGWTWAFDTPFKWTKQIASHFGGTRQGMVMSWPNRITDKGGVRNQFSHFIDIVPTVLEATGIPAPQFVYGIEQKPFDGTSMVYTWDAKPDDPTRHKVQYFEMFGNRGIYNNGWYANTTPIVDPWSLFSVPAQDVMNSFKWELYDLTKDWTQNNDLAAEMPDKLRDMQQLFIAEASKYHVFPLDNSLAPRMVTPRPSVIAGKSHFEYTYPVAGNPNGTEPLLLNASYKITADIEVGEDGGDGMLFTQGGKFGGHGFYILKGVPVYTWNLVDLERVRWESDTKLTPGKHTLEFEFNYDGLGFGTFAFNSLSGVGRGAEGVMRVDGKEVARQKMEHTIPITLAWDESQDIGSDTLTGVNDADYQVPFAFNGTIDKITLDITRPKLSPEDIQKLEAAASAQGDKG